MCSVSGQPLVYLSRVETFSAAHRLNCEPLDEQTNSQLFGKCNSIHGHNYRVKVTVKGPVDKVNGMALDISILKTIICETVMTNLDHKFIDEDVHYFRDNHIVSTAENIAVYIWKILSQKLPENVCLDSVKLYETDKNIVVFRGQFI